MNTAGQRLGEATEACVDARRQSVYSPSRCNHGFGEPAVQVHPFKSRTIVECVRALEKFSDPKKTRIDLRDSNGRDSVFGLSRIAPIYGDDVLPEPPLSALTKGMGREIDLLIGTNREEMNLYFVPTGVRKSLSGPLAFFVLSRLQPNALSTLRAYGLWKNGRHSGEVFTEALHDLVFRAPARQFAAAHHGHTHFYEFDWRSPACDGELGACHGLELPFVFNTLATCSGPNGLAGENPPEPLAQQVHKIWVAFATDGQTPWPEYHASARDVFALDSGICRRELTLPAEQYLS